MTAVKVTESPAQIGLDKPEMDIVGVTKGFTVTDILLLATAAGEAQFALEVSTHQTESLFDSERVP